MSTSYYIVRTEPTPLYGQSQSRQDERRQDLPVDVLQRGRVGGRRRKL